MKIMKVVYSQECSEHNWDGSGSRSYMGEDSWTVGETFKGEFIRGAVTSIEMGHYPWDNSLHIRVDGNKLAMTIPPHAVQRVYYGEE